ncbi:hypothetical protein AbraIFM66951_001551 [Aspergillus brasiliensis]|uniref:Uncharacterized protein n=1 Tax=Aspergillus brasiliensis TaxID=319629 RepID=A0A9W5Z160_9EURO|nr:hypothetical protein AbraCBS73388_001336 [Aspergillus brasiliensis]GKZ49151.1 hypothetical protein AbraIFM66951_001551 [Aspergillus brasiliensis]
MKSLESFFGIGNLTSTRLLARFHIHPTCKVGELANKQVLDITAALSDMKIENDLRRQYLDNIKRLKETADEESGWFIPTLNFPSHDTGASVGALRRWIRSWDIIQGKIPY